MSKRADKKRARRRKKANHGKRPGAWVFRPAVGIYPIAGNHTRARRCTSPAGPVGEPDADSPAAPVCATVSVRVQVTSWIRPKSLPLTDFTKN
ncbi:hypothetical protein ABIA39_000839 [Nocardia sp. GAS34]|uniref:50S ribosomal protein bL37 n=1 Tax=unclassified Nocardia TaxID=2637762 RepID=UPI003D218257